MYAAPGIGLAATQVDRHIQMLVLDVSEEKNPPLTIVNPRIVERAGSQTCQEGCLSVPGIFADVERADRIRVAAQDVTGGRSRSRPMACSRSASSTRWII